jgi:hypothetical protein
MIMGDPFRTPAQHRKPRRKIARRLVFGSVAAITAGTALLAVGGPAEAGTGAGQAVAQLARQVGEGTLVIRYTPRQPLCQPWQAGLTAVIAGDGWHMFPARCVPDGPVFAWDALPVPRGSFAADGRLCAGLAAFNAAGLPSADQLGAIAWDGIHATRGYRRDAGTLVGRIVKGKPFRAADYRLQYICEP